MFVFLYLHAERHIDIKAICRSICRPGGTGHAERAAAWPPKEDQAPEKRGGAETRGPPFSSSASVSLTAAPS